MNNLPSYCGLVDLKKRDFDKDLPVQTKIGEGVEVETEIMIRNAEEVEVEIGMKTDVGENRRMGLQANVPSLRRPRLKQRKK